MGRVAGILFGFAAVAAIVVCFSSAPAFSADAAPASGTGGAKMVAAPEEFDFGEINEGDKPKAVFTLKNTGTEKLVIYDAKPSCGCTLANLSSKEIAPGGTATLEAVFNSQNAHGGPVAKTVTVKTNDLQNPARVLRLKGVVKTKPAPILTLSPFRADDVKVASGATERRLVKITNTGQLDLTVNEVTSSPGISAKVDKFDVGAGTTVKMSLVLKPGEVRNVDVSITPAAKPGPFQEVITFRSDSHGMPATVYVARGTVQ